MRNKRNDQIFTPLDIVYKMLDLIGYKGDNIRTKTIFEPSFGAGIFLNAILARIIEYADENKLSNEEIVEILDNVHGVEIDKELFEKTKLDLIVTANMYGIDYDWPNLICGDTTKLNYDKQFDLCIGNPPYIRVHDLSDEERDYIEEHYEFSQGNTDLYITFFELGLKSIKDDGKLCFITPNSFFKNSSQKEFRKHLLEDKLLDAIVDYGDVLVFDGISTYTAITLLNKNKNRTGDESPHQIEYTKMKNRYADDYTRSLSYEELNSASFVFVSSDEKDFLEKSKSSKEKLSDLCEIQYGLATNADKIYLVKKEDVGKFEREMLRPVVKGSTLNDENYMIFPYKWNEDKQRYDLIDEITLQKEFPKTYTYLLIHRTRLLKRDLEKDAIWYQYGRSQGIQSSNKNKLVIKHVLSSDADKCEFKLATKDVLVYSGLFITIKDEKDKDRVIEILQSKELCRYLKLVGKDMSGGYKSFNGKALKDFGIINKGKK